MKVPFLDLKKNNFPFEKEYLKRVKLLLKNGSYILGNEVKDFELNYAKFHSIKYCVGVGNGLDALIISLKSLQIKENDEIIVPANTFIATLLAVSYVGAKPILVEPRIDTYNIDPEKIEEKITKRTKAVIAVNLYGQAAELSKIKRICYRHKLHLIEDNAQAQGAFCNNKMTGTYGIVNATSFYPGKNLGAIGDAGAITTNNIKIYDFILRYRNYGSKIKYIHDIKGINSRLDEIQAAFLNIKLKNLHHEIKSRQRIASIYSEELNNYEAITLPRLANNVTSVYHLYVIRNNKRKKMQDFLNKKGISTLIHYPIPPHLQKSYTDLSFSKGDYPISELIAETCLSLPMYGTMTDTQVTYVIENIKKYLR